MTDRELLELAAKAAGYEMWWSMIHRCLLEHNGGYWNPLTDDGDALRLAVKLRMDIRIYGTDVRVACCGVVAMEGPPDFYAATRRAIVRAAAGVGRSMP